MCAKFVSCATFTITALCFSLVSVHGGEPKPELSIQSAWARPAAMTGMSGGSMSGDMKNQSMKDHGAGGTSAVYLTLVNKSDAPDALVAASCDAANTVELHETQMKGNVMRMVPIPRIGVPAKGRTELKPRGLHLMLIDLKRDLKPGDEIKIKLRFEKSGEKELTVKVRKP
jgi:copper(I)-binding protein